MHYFKRNIGDYAKKAGRLSMLQHGAYTLLIDACYDREEFPTLEEAIEWTWASTTEEEEAVKFVLRKFFTLENGRYVQSWIKEEIAEYRSKNEKNKRIAIERETNRKQKSTNRARTVHEAPPNQEPITNNQEPITKNQEPITKKEEKEKIIKKEKALPAVRAHVLQKPEDVPDQVWQDFSALRKTKRAPLTATALTAIRREAESIHMSLQDALGICCARGWQGFKAEWIADRRRPQCEAPRETFRERDQRLARERLDEALGRKPARAEVIDITPLNGVFERIA